MSPNKTSIPRIHSVRMKAGGAKIRVLHALADEDRSIVEHWVRSCLDNHANNSAGIAGFAFVVWDKEGGVSFKALQRDSCIPDMLIPDFIRNLLLADKILTWGEIESHGHRL